MPCTPKERRYLYANKPDVAKQKCSHQEKPTTKKRRRAKKKE